MQQTFEHLLGLQAETALALLKAAGILDVQVVPTAAPPRKNPSADDALRSVAGEAQGYASTRVVAVKDEGRTLVVSRFLVGAPRERAPRPEESF
jgi:hypothetical protein